MKKGLLLLCAVMWMTASFAQGTICVRDSNLLKVGGLLSPAPYTPDSPFYNLNIACIDKPYTQPVTVNVPSVFVYQGIQIPLTSVSIPTTGAVSNLPVGLTYNCDPPNCVFQANTLGCILIYGTPTSANTPDTFDLNITANVSTPFGIIPLTFPGTTAPGSHYYLILRSAADCLGSATYNLNGELPSIKNTPNPFSAQTSIEIESLVNGAFQFDVFDLLGQRVYAETIQIFEGKNQFTFDAGELANGAYYYTISNAKGMAARRMLVSR